HFDAMTPDGGPLAPGSFDLAVKDRLPNGGRFVGRHERALEKFGVTFGGGKMKAAPLEVVGRSREGTPSAIPGESEFRPSQFDRGAAGGGDEIDPAGVPIGNITGGRFVK